jgi:hypothetical protein
MGRRNQRLCYQSDMLPEETRQIRRARERRESIVRGTTAATKPTTERRSVRAWHIALGIPIAFVGIGSGIAATGPAFFNLGAGLAAAGLAWLLFDWWFFSKDLWLIARLGGTCGTLIIAGALGWVVFRPAPLPIDVALLPGNYPDGSVVGGIKWNSQYGGFDLSLRNDSDFQYTNIDFLIRTNLMIAEIGSTSKFSQCSAKPVIPGLQVQGAYIAGHDEKGNPVNIPVGEFTRGDIFKVYCDKILPNDFVTLTIATHQRPGEGGFKEPAATSLRGSFDGFGQSRPLQKQACLIKGCAEIPYP